MRNKLRLMLLLLLPVFGNAATADDEADITAVVQKYFDGTEKGKPDLLTEAILPTLELQYVDGEGEFKSITGPSYIGRITPGREYNRKGHIVSIDVTDNAAVVKAVVDMPKRLFTDYLLLLKVKGEWRISNKIATNRPK